MKKLLLICTGLVLNLSLIAQTKSLKGILNDQDNQAMEFANVLLFKVSDSSFVSGTLTEASGSYLLENVSPGDYYLEFGQIGYQSANSDIIVVNSSDPDIIDLPSYSITEGISLEEVTVSGQKPLIELQADKVVVNVANSAVDVGNNALDVLQKSPGVTVDQDNNIALKGKQGVLILLDGKNQYISNEQLSRLLETMPANAIEKIEIMHNPSAKYDAAGNAGIINIKLKKKENLGSNGTMTLGIGQGKYPKANGGVSLNYRSEKINLYGNYDYRYWKGFQDLTIDRTVPVENGVSQFVQNSDFINTSNSHNYKIGMDYYLSDKTTLGVMGRGSFGNWDGSNKNHTNISGVNIQGFDQSNTFSEGREDWNQYAGNFNISHTINETSELNFDFDISNFSNPQNISYDNFFFDADMDPVMDPFFLNNTSETDVEILASKLDYSKAFASGIRIETGVKFSDVLTRNSTVFKNKTGEIWEVDPQLTNTFNYSEEIYAGYLNTSKSFGKITVQGGLRVEHTVSDGNSVTLDQQVKREYTNLFPSLSISHPIGDKHSLSYSYSRRLDRPTYRNLNPFIYFLDQFTFEKGNPFLNPQITNSFGLNYGLERKLYVSLNYSKTHDAMTQVIEQNDETQQTFQTMVNLDSYQNYSLNITAPIVISQGWTSRLSFTGLVNDFKSELESGTLDQDQTTFRVNANNEFSINNRLNAEFSGWYQSSMRFGIFVMKPRYSFDMGISLKVMDGLGKLRLSANDIFNTLHNEVDVQQDNIDLLVNSDWESQRVNLAFSYNFGNQKVKQARKRRTANSDEEARVSRNN